MKQKNRILSLIDFSEHSETVIRYSIEYAKLIDAEIVFVHQIAGMAPILTDENSHNQIMSHEIKGSLQKLKLLTIPYDSEKFQYVVSDKNILTILNDLKRPDYMDWVFMGIKEMDFIKKTLLGSVILKVVDRTNFLSVAIPVSIKRKSIAPSQLIIAVNNKFPLNKNQLDIVLFSLLSKNTSIEFVTFQTEAENEMEAINYLKELKNSYKQYGASIKLFKSDDAFSEIKDYMAEKEGAFLIVQQGSRTFTDSIFRKFMINDLVYNGKIPLIIISQ